MTFDGPGRQAALRRQGLVLRPDWEAVLTPVLDAMLARPDVDRERVAVIGLDHAGYGVPRALSVERRFAAAVVAPGIVDASRPWMMRCRHRCGRRGGRGPRSRLTASFISPGCLTRRSTTI